LDSSTFNFPFFLIGVVEICRIRAEQKEITFNYQVLNQLPNAVNGDEKRLRQVLINLLGNAIKFTEKGGVIFKVGVIGKGEDSDPSPLTKIRFYIEDTGVGMAPEQLEKIFLPFEQVGNSQQKAEGTGLGLAIAQKIVQMMGGEIKVESILGQGSIFCFDLEFTKSSEFIDKPSLNTSINLKGFKGNKNKILLVDDGVENRGFIRNFLEPLGFKIMEACNGQEGLNKAIDFQPDLIITDLVMPVMDGFEMSRCFRKSSEFKDVILIASSASVFEFDRQNSQEAGCNEFLSKPLQVEELLEVLKKYLQIEWIYDQPADLANAQPEGFTDLLNVQSGELVIPPSTELVALFNAARIGDIEVVEQEADRLKQIDGNYLPFANKILQFAKNFEEKELLAFVKKHLGK
ncbi:MAG TPA: ATP-binding protein, partial [Bacillales bacterium]|nr:ATP-binding protein [Bacillales bacterium]